MGRGRGRGRGRGGPQTTGTDQYGEDHFDRDDAGPAFGGKGGRGGGDGGDASASCVPLVVITRRDAVSSINLSLVSRKSRQGAPRLCIYEARQDALDCS